MQHLHFRVDAQTLKQIENVVLLFPSTSTAWKIHPTRHPYSTPLDGNCSGFLSSFVLVHARIVPDFLRPEEKTVNVNVKSTVNFNTARASEVYFLKCATRASRKTKGSLRHTIKKIMKYTGGSTPRTMRT
jgi:hypothetical protein